MSDKPSPADQHTGPADFAQQTPIYGDGREIYQQVLHDVITRSEFGARKYGHALRDSANVDWLVNAYQELLDLLIYLRGEIAAREGRSAEAENSTPKPRTCCHTKPFSAHADYCRTLSDRRECCQTRSSDPHALNCVRVT